jgi:hypothetical protein
MAQSFILFEMFHRQRKRERQEDIFQGFSLDFASSLNPGDHFAVFSSPSTFQKGEPSSRQTGSTMHGV